MPSPSSRPHRDGQALAGLTPRRLSGLALRVTANADRLPLLGAGVRAAGRSLIGIETLREARLDPVRPWLAPPGPTTPTTPDPAGDGA